MIAEVVDSYDMHGRQVFRPGKKGRAGFAPTFPMGRYVSQPLTVRCRDFDDIRAFLYECRYMSDEEQFGKMDYWMPPEEFEERKRGDCDDFALWAWRQVMALGYEARFATGRAGAFGSGHAWVTFVDGDRKFILEATARRRPSFPRLETLRYHPNVSVSWSDERIRYFEHAPTRYDLPLRSVLPLVPEWVSFKGRYFADYAWAATRYALRVARARIRPRRKDPDR